jgi:hypothetical protein
LLTSFCSNGNLPAQITQKLADYEQQKAQYQQDLQQWRKDFKDYQEQQKEQTTTVDEDVEMVDAIEGIQMTGVSRPSSPLLREADAWLEKLGEELLRR